MLVLPNRPQEHLMTLALVADVIRDQHMNHERRGERIDLLARMIQAQMDGASPLYLSYLYTLHALLFALRFNPVSMRSTDPTHTEVKIGLRLFSEICQHAIKAIDQAEAEARETRHGS